MLTLEEPEAMGSALSLTHLAPRVQNKIWVNSEPSGSHMSYSSKEVSALQMDSKERKSSYLSFYLTSLFYLHRLYPCLILFSSIKVGTFLQYTTSWERSYLVELHSTQRLMWGWNLEHTLHGKSVTSFEPTATMWMSYLSLVFHFKVHSLTVDYRGKSCCAWWSHYFTYYVLGIKSLY